MKVFSWAGLLKARTLDIAGEAELSHGAVFLHFPTRDDLLFAVIKRFGLRLAARIHELAQGGAGIRAVMAAHLEGVGEQEAFYGRLVKEGHLLPKRSRSILIGIQSAVSHHLAEAFEHELKQGSVRSLPQHLVFNGWIGLVHHYLLNGDAFAPEGSVIGKFGSHLIDYYYRLISIPTKEV